MDCFLREERRRKLFSQLSALDMPIEIAAAYMRVPDDLGEIDARMANNARYLVEIVEELAKLPPEDERYSRYWIGYHAIMYVLKTYKAEALERHLGARNFPLWFEATKRYIGEWQ